MAQIDRLDITIETSVKNAKAQITQLQNELKEMQKTLGQIKSGNAFKQTGKGASNVTSNVRKQTKQMVNEYKKAATMMTTIRDKMASKVFNIPDTAMGAKQALEKYQKMYATAREKVMAAKAHGDNRGKVYRNQVEDMYNAAKGAAAARKVLSEKAAKDDAYQRLLDEERAAKEAAQSVEQIAQSYSDVSASAKEASYSVKYVNRSLLEQAKNSRIAASPYIKTGKLNWGEEQATSSFKSVRDNVSNVIAEIKAKAGEMRAAVAQSFDGMKSKVADFKVAMREKGVASGILSYTQDFVTLQKSIQRSRAELARLTQAMQEYKAAGGSENDRTYQRYQAREQMIRDDLSASLKAERGMKYDGSAYEINTKTAESNLANLQNAFNKLGNDIKRVTKSIGAFLLKLTGIKNASRKAKDAMNNVTGIAKRLSKELTRVGKMAKLMITRMAIRAVINNVGDGFKSLALHSEEFNNSMSNLINSAKTLGYSIAGMVSPLINALAPALTYIIELITQAVNALNQLFRAFGGFTTWNKAKKFTDSWADSIKGASGAAKELKKTVLGFDELNQLQDNKSSGGGGGGLEDMFETVDIDPKWMKIKDWLKDMWKMGDFTELGTKIGTKLRDLLESIPWEQIKETSNKLGKSLATLINGFVEVERLGYDIGHTIAQSVNTVFEFLNGFVHNLHWDSIGKFIADTFNGFFEGIDWPLIKDTVITGMKGLADAINSFVRNFHWDNISDFISNGVNTIVSGIYTFIKRVDWKELATNLGDQLNKTIKKIDWKQLGRTLGAIIQSAIDFVKTFIKQLDWKTVKKAISDLLSGFFEEVNKEDLAKAVAAIIGIVVVKGVALAIPGIIAKGLGSTILGAIFGGSAGAGGMTAAATSAGASIGGAIVAGIGLGLAGINLIKDPLWDLTVKLGANEEKVNNLKETYKGFGGTLEFVGESIKETWYKITGQDDKLEELYSSVKVLDDGYGNLTKTVGYFGDTIIEFDDKVGDITKSTEGQIKVYDNARASVADYTDAVKENADRMIDIKVGIDEYGKTVSEVSETILPKLGEKTYAAKTAQESLEAAISDYRDRLQEVKDHQVVYKTHLDVIREAQKKNVKEVEGTAKEYQVLKDEVGQTTIVIQDSKPAYEKAGDAAKDASGKVADYVASSDDVIKVIPDMNKEVETVKTTMDDVSKSVSDSAEELRGEFSKDKWQLDGVNEGLSSTFEKALSSIKEKFKSAFSWINDKLKIETEGKTVSLGKIGGSYATGGFPEDGLFMANHNELVGKFSNGKTAVANNEQIVAGIERGVFNAVSSAMASQSGSGQYIANNIYLDGNKIATAVSRSQEKQNRRYSPAY